MTAPVEVPELVRQRALSNGAAGRSWLDDLPDVVAELAARWDLELGSPFSGGTASYVAAANDSAGRACVLKVAMPLDMHGARRLQAPSHESLDARTRALVPDEHRATSSPRRRGEGNAA